MYNDVFGPQISPGQWNDLEKRADELGILIDKKIGDEMAKHMGPPQAPSSLDQHTIDAMRYAIEGRLGRATQTQTKPTLTQVLLARLGVSSAEQLQIMGVEAKRYGDNVVTMLVTKDGRGVVWNTPPELYPADDLIGQIRLLLP